MDPLHVPVLGLFEKSYSGQLRYKTYGTRLDDNLHMVHTVHLLRRRIDDSARKSTQKCVTSIEVKQLHYDLFKLQHSCPVDRLLRIF